VVYVKKSLRIIIALITVLFVAILVTEFQVIYFGENAKPKRSDCIIVLGCKVSGKTPSAFLKERTNEGLRLYKEGYGSYIIVSGGKGSGEDISEAQAMKSYLIFKGMDSSKIILEDKSSSTLENLTNSKEKMDANGFKTAIIVSNKYHLKRASMIAKWKKIDASYSGVFVPPYKNYEILGYIREVPAIWKYIAYEVIRKI
jgi:uncharacterized SAM-binding protein YcdF (DUF218 family)